MQKRVSELIGAFSGLSPPSPSSPAPAADKTARQRRRGSLQIDTSTALELQRSVAANGGGARAANGASPSANGGRAMGLSEAEAKQVIAHELYL